MNKFFLIFILSIATSAFALEIDKEKSTFQWTGTKVTGKHTGKIKLKEAKVNEEADQKTKKSKVAGGKLILDLNSITCEDLTGEYNTKLINHLKSEDFFNVEKWPTASLEITELKKGKAKGKLTIKGKSHTVSIPYKNSGNTYSGTLKFDRTKFGMVYKSKNFFKKLGDKAIHDEVKLDFKVVLK